MSTTVYLNLLPVHAILERRGMQARGKVQVFLGTEIARRSDKYVPLRTGTLKNTAYVSNGGEQIVYPQPYARKQYLGTPDTRPYDSLRGAHWVSRMWAAEGKDVVEGAAKIAGGRAK